MYKPNRILAVFDISIDDKEKAKLSQEIFLNSLNFQFVDFDLSVDIEKISSNFSNFRAKNILLISNRFDTFRSDMSLFFNCYSL